MSEKKKIGFDISPNVEEKTLVKPASELEQIIDILLLLHTKKGECKHCKKENQLKPMAYDLENFDYVMGHIHCSACKHQSVYMVRYE